MAMTRTQFLNTVSPLMNVAFDGAYQDLPPEWSQLFTVEQGLKRAYEEEYTIAGLERAKLKGEGEAVYRDSGGEAYKTRFDYRVFAISHHMSKELVEDGEHVRLGAIYSREAAASMREAKEIVHADIFTRAFNAAFPGGDGVSLCNVAHPLFSGGTFENSIGNVEMSEAAIEDLLVMVRLAVDERGKQRRLRPIKFICHPDNEYTASRILGSAQQSGTANNDLNAIRTLGRLPTTPFVLTRLGVRNAFFIQTDAPRGLIHKWRRRVEYTMEGDFETDNVRNKWTERYAENWHDPRCLYGSEGPVV